MTEERARVNDPRLAALLTQVKEAFVPMPAGQAAPPAQPAAGAGQMSAAMAGGGMAAPPADGGMGMGMAPGMGDPMAGIDPMSGAPLGMPPGEDPSAGGGLPPPNELMDAVRQVVREEMGSSRGGQGSQSSGGGGSKGSGNGVEGDQRDAVMELIGEVRQMVSLLQQIVQPPGM